MKIIDIQRFINRFKLLTEGVTLPNIRQGILGKKGRSEYPVVDDEKKWYEEHKEEFLSTIEKVLNVDNKTLQNKLQKFDTDPYFTNDKPRKLKPKELLKAVKRNFISQVERSRNTEEKTSGIEAQYEMMEMGNGVEVYAVYTPMANHHLTHTKLWVLGCFSPTWCIASSTANNYWNHYHLYEAEYPSVFIVAQKVKNSYNPIKYELKCDPHKSVSFKNGEISLEEWVDEWRNPEQTSKENSFKGTYLFGTFKITPKDLQNTIKKLVNSKKSSNFSKKFGKEMLNLYTQKINSKDEDTKMEYLTKACKNGTLINFCDKIDRDDKDYFLDELIRYDTLTEMEVQKMNIQNNNKALSNLIKNKRCTHKSLEWANKYFDKYMVRRVYHSLPDDILSLETIEGVNVRKAIFENIKKDKGLTEEFVNYQIKNGIVSNTTLECIKDDEALFKKCVYYLIENDKVDNDILEYYIERDKDLFKKYIEFLIKNDKVDNYTLKYIKNDRELLKKCVENMLKNDKVDNRTLRHVVIDKELLRKCVYYLIENDKVDNDTLYYAMYDKELFKKCLEILIKNDKVNNGTLEYVKNDKVLLKKCLDLMYENSNLNGKTLRYVLNDKELFAKYLERIIESDNVDFETINYDEVKFNNKLLSRCLISLVKNENINSKVFYLILDNRFYHLIKPAIKAAIKEGDIGERYIEAFETVGENREKPEVREGLSLVIKALSSQDDVDIDWSYILIKLIDMKFTENIKEVYNLLLNSYSDEDEQCEEVNELIKYASRTLDSQMYSNVEKLIVDGGIYDENTLFEFRNEKYISEMLINLDKNDKLRGDYLEIMNYLSNESLKHILPTILNLKSFDIIDYIYGLEYDFDDVSRFLGATLEIGYHLNCDVLNVLLEINFDNEEILEKIISDNIKENREKVMQILSEHDKEDLLK